MIFDKIIKNLNNPEIPKRKINEKLMKNKIEKIVELSKKLKDIENEWYYKINKPLTQGEIFRWCRENNVFLPEEYVIFISMMNGFCVDYSSATGYFNICKFDTTATTDLLYSRTKEQMAERDERHIKNCKHCFGWLNHQCLYYNPYTAEIFIERKRYDYTPIEDFEKEILDCAIEYLEKQIELFSRKKQLLNKNLHNPLRPFYDKLLEYAETGRLNIHLKPPATEAEIADCEKKNNIKLPEEYRNWIKLSNGGEFEHKFILSLEQLCTAYGIEEIDGVEYVILVGLTGCFDYLVFEKETGKYAVLTEEFAIEEASDFEDMVFNDAFEYMDEELECE